MGKRRIYTISSILILLAIALIILRGFDPSYFMPRYAEQVSVELQKQETELAEQLTDTAFFIRELSSQALPSNDRILNNPTQSSFNLCLHQGDSILYWLHNRILPQPLPEKGGWKQLANGYYYVKKASLQLPDLGNIQATAFLPVYYDYRLESQHLKDHFHGSGQVPPEVIPVSRPSPYPIINSRGESIAFLDYTAPFQPRTLQWIILSLWLGIGITFCILLNFLANGVARRKSPLLGALVLVVGVLGLRSLMIAFNFSGVFTGIELFSNTFSTPVLNSSLGDLLINILLLLWLMIFFHREFQLVRLQSGSPTLRIILSVINYLAIIFGLLLIISTIKNLVLGSGINLDFDNILNLSIYSILALIGLILLLLALFLFSHRMTLSIIGIGLKPYARIGSFAVAAILSIPLVQNLNLGISVVQVMLLSVIFIVLLDLFIDADNPNLSWLMGWLFIFAAFSAVLLFKYNSDKDLQIREDIARKLAQPVDTLAELHIAGALKEGRALSQVPYLRQNYRMQQVDSPWEAVSANARRTPYDGVVRIPGSENQYQYLVENQILLTPVDQYHSKAFANLLLDAPFKGLAPLEKYDYAIYLPNGKLLRQSRSKHYPRVIDLEEPLPEGAVMESVAVGDRSDLVYRSQDGTLVIVGRDLDGLRPFSLFAFLFSMLILAVPILSLLNGWLKALPNTLDFTIARRPSLRNKIQLWVIILILLSFVLIGVVTGWYYMQSSDYRQEVKVKEKIDAILEEFDHEAALYQDTFSTSFQYELALEPIARIHQMDLHLFDTNGKLIQSSEPGLYNEGILAPFMGFQALQMLRRTGEDLVIEASKAGTLRFKTAYLPLNGAYLGIPFYSERQEVRSELGDFIETLLSVYVFLLLIAGVVAIFVANSITQPLSNLGESIRELKLGHNKPIPWESKDEIGTLINEYNRMLQKLEESTRKLAQSERESAWREMAKQVAHEIKNPLTPMKLSIQYLEHAMRSNPENAQGMIEQVSKTLIEQIDALSRIASEFSAFAKMPQAQNDYFELNGLIHSVHDLFSKERPEVQVELDMPPQPFQVYADKSQLMRVFNNLYKNAIQAIPNDRQGLIRTRVFPQNGKVIVKVSDNGTGIPADMRKKVFVPNFTTKSSGTGLGLAISRNIIETANGRLYFETEENVGTDFFVELPIQQSDA